MEERKVLLISPPWLLPRVPGLAIATLRPLLRAAGIPCDDLHGSTLFPYSETLTTSVMETFSAYLFVPYAYPGTDRERLVDGALERLRQSLNFGGIRVPDQLATLERLGIDRQRFREDMLRDMERAGECIERIVAAAARPEYDIVGFSCTFESQLPATLAIARRLRAANPALKIILGGATCFEEQGDGLCASFPVFDAVCHTEGEGVIVPLIRALREGAPLSQVPGIAWRAPEGVRHNPSPPVPRDLDQLPVPDYDRYLAQYLSSEWRDHAPPRLLFETSRGCWWGQKHLCTFCGLNPEGLSYRFKSPARTFDEIRALYTRYPQATFLQSTDNILPMPYIKEVMPRLRAMEKDPGRPLEMFFMIKSNLRRDQLAAIFAGGVTKVQPGVESFHDEILVAMDKGVTGAGQVQLIKWATEVGISMSYNLIIRSPGDRPEHYYEMGDLIARICHLPPPTGVTPMMLNRFSLYHSHPERYGITGARPRRHYGDLYPDPAVDLFRVAYEFEFDHPVLHDEAMVKAQRYFLQRFDWWWQVHRPDLAYYLDRGAAILIHDRRPDGADGVLTGSAAELYRYLDQARTEEAVLARAAARGLDPALVRCLLETWLHRGWLCRIGGHYLAVLPGKERPEAEAVDAAPRRSLRVVAA